VEVVSTAVRCAVEAAVSTAVAAMAAGEGNIPLTCETMKAGRRLSAFCFSSLNTTTPNHLGEL